MKHVLLVLLAMATALAIAPSAMASPITYGWSFLSTTSNATMYIDGSGTFTVNSGTNAITGINGTITDTIDKLTVPIDGLISEPGNTFTFMGGTYTYNDMLSGGALGSSANNGGVYFSIDGDGDSALLTSDSIHIFFPALNSNSAGMDARSISEESITVAPEPASLVLLGTGFMGLALVLYRKSSRPAQLVNA